MQNNIQSVCWQGSQWAIIERMRTNRDAPMSFFKADADVEFQKNHKADADAKKTDVCLFLM